MDTLLDSNNEDENPLLCYSKLCMHPVLGAVHVVVLHVNVVGSAILNGKLYIYFIRMYVHFVLADVHVNASRGCACDFSWL